MGRAFVYDGAMATVTNIITLGNQLSVRLSDGSSATATQGPGGLWFVKNEEPTPPVPGGGGGGGYGKYALVNPLPASIGPITDYNGTHTLTGNQVKNAADIIASAAQYPGINDDMMKAVIVCALVESVMRIYANSNVPESLNYPHEMVGSDHMSVGLFQQQVPDFGWGSVRDCMITDFSVKSFLGGEHGPRRGGPPPGLMDTPRTGTIGKWVQDTQVSAHPERYDDSLGAVDIIMDALIVKQPPGGGGGAGSMVQPFAWDGYDSSDPFGATAGRSRPHTGSDYNRGGITTGTDARMISAGVVEHVEYTDYNGWVLSVRMDESPWYWAFIHGADKPSIDVGTRVEKGQTGIFRVGNTGYNSLGAHLHITLSDTVNAYQGLGSLQDPYAFIQARIG